MKAVILAAGQGTRLAPITNNEPKCLVELGGSSLLANQISNLKSSGITDITVVAGYLSKKISERGFRMLFNREFASSNMVHTLFYASDLMTDDADLVIAYGDIVYQSDVLKAVLDSDAPISVAVDQNWRRYWELRMDNPLSDAETMKIDEHGMITELGKKPRNYEEIQGQFIGLIKVHRNHLVRFRQLHETMDPNISYEGTNLKQIYMTTFIQYAINHGWPVKAVPISNGWLEVDTYKELKLYRRMEANGTLSDFFRF